MNELNRNPIVISYLVFVLIATLTVQSFAQNSGTIKGKIIDKATKSPLSFVNILVVGTGLGSSTKLDGSFTLTRVPVGRQMVVASAIGYRKVSQEILVERSKESVLELDMEEAPVSSPEVTVSADLPVTAASSQTIRALDFELRPRLSSQDLLRMVPGLFIAQHAGGGKAEQIFLRGFDADHGTDVNISVDGIPVNMVSHGHGQGYADLHFLMPEVLRGLEVYKGPYFVQSGDFGTAGTVKFNTLDDIDHSSLNIEGGSFGLIRAVALARLPLESDMVSGYAAGEVLHNDSYFDHKQNFQRYNLFAKAKMRFDANQSLTLWASGFGSTWDASGQIPERAVEDGVIDRFGSIDPSEGGETNRQNANLIYAKAGERSNLMAQAYAARYHFKLFSDFTFYKIDPINGDEIEQDDDRTIFGGRGEYTFYETFGNPNINTLLGLSVRTDAITNQLWHAVKRRRLENRKNDDIQQTNVALFTQQEYLLFQYMRLQLGVRYDYFLFDVHDKLNTGTAADITGIVGQEILSPKANLIISPSTKLDLFVNFGTGFHSNDARAILAQRTELTLPRAVGAELGARYTPTMRFTTSCSFWALDLEHEFVYSGDEGTTEESGATRRIGIDVDARAQLVDWLWADLDLTISQGRFKDLPDGENFVPLAPTLTSTGGLTARSPVGIEGTLRYRHIGERPANEENTIQAKGYTVFDAGLAYRLQGYRISLMAENLFNTTWNEAQFDTESQLRGESHPVSELHFTPGTPLSLRAKIEVGL